MILRELDRVRAEHSKPSKVARSTKDNPGGLAVK